MADEIVLDKQKIVLEDIVLDTTDSVTQTRNGATFVGSPVQASGIPYSPTESIGEGLDDRYTKAESDVLITDNTNEIEAILAELRSFYLGTFADRAAVEAFILAENIQLSGGESYWDQGVSLFYVWNDTDLLWKNIPLTMDGVTNTGDINAVTGTATYVIPNGFTGTAINIYVDGSFKTRDIDYTTDSSAGTITFTGTTVTTGEVISFFAFNALSVVEYPNITVTDDPLNLPATPAVGDIAWLYGTNGAEAMVTYTLPDQTGKDNQFLISLGGVAQWSDMITQDVADVAAISAEVVIVADNTANINTVATDTASINTVSTNIVSVNTVSTNVLDVNTVAGDTVAINDVTSNPLRASILDVTTDPLRQAVLDAVGTTPIGGIIMYDGLVANIPANWALCDGTGGTPNLVDQFIFGTATELDIGTTGGSADAIIPSHSHTANHNHTASSSSVSNHSHSKYAGGSPVVGGAYDYAASSITNYGIVTTGAGGAHGHTITVNTKNFSTSTEGVSVTNANIPPYVKLAYIKRIS